MQRGLTLDQQLAETLSWFREDPLGYVMLAFPWHDDPVIQQVRMPKEYQDKYECEFGPDEWAIDFLLELAEEIKKRKFTGQAVEPICFSTASGHGIGKSALVSWLIKFILDCYPYSKGVVTASTAEQVRTKTWAELAKWNSLSITSHWWHYNNSRASMSLYRKGIKDIQNRWRCDALTCKEENSESFAGHHSAGSVPFYIFDEASGIPDKIFEVRGGGATDGMPIWCDFGNPTRKTGYFFENTIGKYKHRFITRSIDSRSVSITGKAYCQRLLEDYGEDSDYFKVRVKGEFPAQGSVQFISTDLVDDAMYRPAYHDPSDGLYIGVDVARFGDDSTVLYPRLGFDARSFDFRQYRGLDNFQVADKVAEMIADFMKIGKKCNGLFVDGGGLGSGVVDILRRYGYNPIDVVFQARAADRRYRGRVDEMWGKLRDELPKLALPNNQKLKDQLCQREYGFNLQGQIQLESKTDMKERGLESPDIADALSLTFSAPVATITKFEPTSFLVPPKVKHEYDPYQDLL